MKYKLYYLNAYVQDYQTPYGFIETKTSKYLICILKFSIIISFPDMESTASVSHLLLTILVTLNTS